MGGGGGSRRSGRLVGRKVAVRLNSVEARGVEIIATLDEVRDDGVVLSEVGEIGSGPTMFCPWESLHRVRERLPWLAPLGEEPEEFYELREVPEKILEEEAERESLLRLRKPSARTLERVVPVAQKQAVRGITVAISSLEFHGDGLGVLHWRVSFGEERPHLGMDFGSPEPVFEIRDYAGRELSWSPQGSGASDGEADGDVRVEGLPDAGELEVGVPRLVADAYEEGEYRGDGPSWEGPWSFRFAI